MSNDPYSLFYMPKSTQGPDYSKIDSGGGGSSYSWPPKLGEAGGTDHLAMVAQRRRRIQQQHATNMGQAPGVMGGPIAAPSTPAYGGAYIPNETGTGMTDQQRAQQQAFIAGGGWDSSRFGTAGAQAQVDPAYGGARMMQAQSDQARTPEQIAQQQAFVAGGGWDASRFGTAAPPQTQGQLPGWTPGATMPNGRVEGWNTPGGGFVPNEEGSGLAPGQVPNTNMGGTYGTTPGAPPPAAPMDLRARSAANARAMEGQMPTMNGQAYGPAEQNQWAGYGGVAGGPAQPGGYTTGPFPGAAQGGAGGAVPGAGGGAGGTAPGTPPGAPGAWTPPAWNPATGPLINNQPTATGRPEDHPMYANIRDRMTQLLASGNLAAAQQMMRGLG